MHHNLTVPTYYLLVALAVFVCVPTLVAATGRLIKRGYERGWLLSRGAGFVGTAVTSILVFWRPGLPASTSNDQYGSNAAVLTSIGAGFATLLTLVLTVSLILAQLVSRYSARTLTRVFGVSTVSYATLFILGGVLFPLWAAFRPEPTISRIAYVVAAAVLFSIFPFVQSIANQLQREWIFETLLKPTIVTLTKVQKRANRSRRRVRFMRVLFGKVELVETSRRESRTLDASLAALYEMRNQPGIPVAMAEECVRHSATILAAVSRYGSMRPVVQRWLRALPRNLPDGVDEVATSALTDLADRLAGLEYFDACFESLTYLLGQASANNRRNILNTLFKLIETRTISESRFRNVIVQSCSLHSRVDGKPDYQQHYGQYEEMVKQALRAVRPPQGPGDLLDTSLVDTFLEDVSSIKDLLVSIIKLGIEPETMAAEEKIFAWTVSLTGWRSAKDRHESDGMLLPTMDERRLAIVQQLISALTAVTYEYFAANLDRRTVKLGELILRLLSVAAQHDDKRFFATIGQSWKELMALLSDSKMGTIANDERIRLIARYWTGSLRELCTSLQASESDSTVTLGMDFLYGFFRRRDFYTADLRLELWKTVVDQLESSLSFSAQRPYFDPAGSDPPRARFATLVEQSIPQLLDLNGQELRVFGLIVRWRSMLRQAERGALVKSVSIAQNSPTASGPALDVITRAFASWLDAPTCRTSFRSSTQMDWWPTPHIKGLGEILQIYRDQPTEYDDLRGGQIENVTASDRSSPRLYSHWNTWPPALGLRPYYVGRTSSKDRWEGSGDAHSPATLVSSEVDRLYEGILEPRTLVLIHEPDGSKRLLQATNGSVTGFTWGYDGAGPSNLTTALVNELLGPLARCPLCLGAGFGNFGDPTRCQVCENSGVHPGRREARDAVAYIVSSKLTFSKRWSLPRASLLDAIVDPSSAKRLIADRRLG